MESYDADLMCVLGLDEADGCVVTNLTLPMVLLAAPSHPSDVANQ